MMPLVALQVVGIDLRDDQRDGGVHAPCGRVVDDRCPAGHAAGRARATHRLLPRRAPCRPPRTRPGSLRRSRAVWPSIDSILPADRPEASSRSSPTGNSRSFRTWIIVRPTTPVAPTTATVRCRRFIESMAPRVRTGRARREYSGQGGRTEGRTCPGRPCVAVMERPAFNPAPRGAEWNATRANQAPPRRSEPPGVPFQRVLGLPAVRWNARRPRPG